jgi:hypothetical protein
VKQEYICISIRNIENTALFVRMLRNSHAQAKDALVYRLFLSASALAAIQPKRSAAIHKKTAGQIQVVNTVRNKRLFIYPASG